MNRQLAMFAAAALLVVTGAATRAGQQQPPPPDQQPPPVFRTEANFVRVDAFPTRDGRPVHGLTAGDFEVLEDGVPQKIHSFEHVVISTGTPVETRIEPDSIRDAERMAANPRNRVFVVFLDVPHVQVASSHAIKEPLIRLLARTMGPDDLVAVMTPTMMSTQMTFGRKTEVIERGLRENWPWGVRHSIVPLDDRESQYEYCYPPAPGEGAVSGLAEQLKQRRRERMVLEAIHDMLEYLGGVREERKAIIMVTEGWRLYGPQQSLTDLRRGEEVPRVDPVGVGPDGRLRSNPPTTRAGSEVSRSQCDGERMMLAAMDNQRYFRDLLDVANRANASFYPIDPRGLPVFDDDLGARAPLPPALSQAMLRNRLENLRVLASNTDGLAILDSNDLDKGLKRVSDDLTSYYLLGYYSTNTKLDGGFRSLKVRVRSPGVSVRARRGYRAATAAEVAAARTAAAAPVPDGTAAVAAAMSGLARMRTEVPFVVRAASAAPADASGIGVVWITGELQPGKELTAGGSATIEITGGGATTTARAALEAGERAFLIRVPLDRPVGEADVRARFVPEGAPGALPLTSTTRLVARPGLAEPVLFKRGVSTGNRLQPAAHVQFMRSERLRLEVPVAADAKGGTARLLDKAGQPLQVPVTVSERTDDAGQRWLVGDLTLAALGAGDYAVELSAGEQKVITAIRVAR